MTGTADIASPFAGRRAVIYSKTVEHAAVNYRDRRQSRHSKCRKLGKTCHRHDNIFSIYPPTDAGDTYGHAIFTYISYNRTLYNTAILMAHGTTIIFY